MITHRIASGGRPKSAAIAGKAMFTIESSEATNPPAAAIHRVMRRARRRLRYSATPSTGAARRQDAIRLPAPRSRPPVGREDLTALHRREGDHRLANAEARAKNVVDDPIALAQIEHRDI